MSHFSGDSFSKQTSFNDSVMDDNGQRRRSSSRSIKRKKFDDEVVDSVSTIHAANNESTLSPLVENHVEKVSEPISLTPSSLPPRRHHPHLPAAVQIVPSPITPIVPALPKKKLKRSHVDWYENNYWKPIDDLALIINTKQTCDLDKVHRGVKFSSKFTYAELESRWRYLLYNQKIKDLALAAIRQLHPDVVRLVESKALMSEDEEQLLKNIKSNEKNLTLERFKSLIRDHADVFLASRTPKILMNYWSMLKRYQLLCDQSLKPLLRHENVVDFAQIERIVRKEAEEEVIQEERDNAGHAPDSSLNEIIYQETMNSLRKSMLEIRMIENEIPKYQILLDNITGIRPSDFDIETYAVLRGRVVRYLMRSKEITIGRSTDDFKVDVNLTLEGPTAKISRLQAIISLQPTGEFYMFNSGRNCAYIDSKPLLPNASLRVNHNSLVEFSTMKFIFLINHDVVLKMRNDLLQTSK